MIAAFESRRKSELVRVAMRELRDGRRKTRSGRFVSRPRRLTPALVERIRKLRYVKHLPWSVVAQHARIPAGTARKVGPPPPGVKALVWKNVLPNLKQRWATHEPSPLALNRPLLLARVLPEDLRGLPFGLVNRAVSPCFQRQMNS